VGNMVIAIQTLNGIAIAIESPHLARREEIPNIVSLNSHTALVYHETLALGQQMVETILRQQVDLGGEVLSIATQADRVFREFVTQKQIQQPIGFLFLGYTAQGQGAMLGWFHVGDQTKTTAFFPFCTSRPNPIVGYLMNKIYTPDISLAKALELAAYAFTQSRIVLAQTPIIECERFSLAAIDPDQGFSWLDREATESIVRRNEERDQAFRVKCAGLFACEV
jgi:hypothetical protein